MGCGDTRLKWGERDNYKMKVNLIYYRRFEEYCLFQIIYFKSVSYTWYFLNWK